MKQGLKERLAAARRYALLAALPEMKTASDNPVIKASLSRRRFLTGIGALSAGVGLMATRPSVQGQPASAVGGRNASALKITDVQVLLLRGASGVSALYLKLLSEAGTEGLYGPIDEEAAVLVDRFFARRLIGQDGLATEAFWDQMFRANRHSRGSHYLMGLSAVDNALWDLRARHVGLPVYRLLGGSRRKLRAYASCLGFSQEPDALQSKARELEGEGYRHQKWFVNQRGPRFGPEGVKADARVVELLREAVGDDSELMFDASTKWDLQYTLARARRVEPFDPGWIEEPLQSAHLDALTELSRETSIPVAMGEHFYGRWDAHNFLKHDTIRVVQADPEWCGGVSELLKICTLASVHGANVIPHGHSLHAAMHVVASQPIEVCPLVEYLIKKMQGNYYHFEKHVPRPVNGELELSDRPGFGIELDESRIIDMRQVHWNRD